MVTVEVSQDTELFELLVEVSLGDSFEMVGHLVVALERETFQSLLRSSRVPVSSSLHLSSRVSVRSIRDQINSCLMANQLMVINLAIESMNW